MKGTRQRLVSTGIKPALVIELQSCHNWSFFTWFKVSLSPTGDTV